MVNLSEEFVHNVCIFRVSIPLVFAFPRRPFGAINAPICLFSMSGTIVQMTMQSQTLAVVPDLIDFDGLTCFYQHYEWKDFAIMNLIHPVP